MKGDVGLVLGGGGEEELIRRARIEPRRYRNFIVVPCFFFFRTNSVAQMGDRCSDPWCLVHVSMTPSGDRP